MATKKVRGTFTSTYAIDSTMAHEFVTGSRFVVQDQWGIHVKSAFANVIVNSTMQITWTRFDMYYAGVFVEQDHAKVRLGENFDVSYINASGSGSTNNHLNDLTVYGDYSKISNFSDSVGYVEFSAQYSSFKNFGSVETIYAYGTSDIRNMDASAKVQGVYIHDWPADSSGKFTNYGTVGAPGSNTGFVSARDGKSVVNNFGKIFGQVDLEGGDDRFLNGPGAYAPDVIYGGAGNDRYVFHGTTKNINDFKIVERVNEGIDGIVFDGAALQTYFNNRYQIPENVENLVSVSSKNTILSGNSLKNFITAGSGNDQLFGGGGNDRLQGGFGADRLHGGDGVDRFVFFAGDTDRTLQGADRLEDFESVDLIDLSFWDANVKTQGMQDWRFSTNGTFSGQAGLLIVGFAGDSFFIAGDSNGDKKADLYIRFGAGLELPTDDNFVF